MKRWLRAEYERRCGNCGHAIYREQPYLELTSEHWTTPKRRCRDCADEPAPVDLPSLPVKPKRDPLPLTRFDVNSLPLDFKKRSANE